MNFAERLILEAVYRHGRRQVMEDESRDRKLKDAKIKALAAVKVRSHQYDRECILYSMILGIAHKKSSMICEAETISQLREILNPPEPYWNGAEFLPGPYLAAEEELLMWMEVFSQVPLNETGEKRVEQLFGELFPEEMERIFGKK